MGIKRAGTQPSGEGQAEYFTGVVRIDPLFQAPDPARVVVASVTFDGKRVDWLEKSTTSSTKSRRKHSPYIPEP